MWPDLVNFEIYWLQIFLQNSAFAPLSVTRWLNYMFNISSRSNKFLNRIESRSFIAMKICPIAFKIAKAGSTFSHILNLPSQSCKILLTYIGTFCTNLVTLVQWMSHYAGRRLFRFESFQKVLKLSSSSRAEWPDDELKSSPKFSKSCPKINHSGLTWNVLLFGRAQNTQCIWATIDRNLVTKKFQKLPNLVTLISSDTWRGWRKTPFCGRKCRSRVLIRI